MFLCFCTDMDLFIHSGLKEDMKKLEKDFLDGGYTPFSSVPATMPPSTPKRKRRKVGKNMYNALCC